jgi:hypothetical protein
MDELEIIRLNVERYPRLLQTEADEGAWRAIQKMLERVRGQAFPGKAKIQSSREI